MGNDRIIYFSIERVIMRGYVRDTKEVDHLAADRRPLAKNYYRHTEDDGD